MAASDGDGWALCARGHRHWGIFGASGLLVVHRDTGGSTHVLMQHRSFDSHHGGTWALPGGARDSHESSVETALREAAEEAAIARGDLRVQGVYLDDHGGWSFETVIAAASVKIEARPANGESIELRWLPVADVAAQPLHPGFAETWPAIMHVLRPLRIVLDAANVVGSRADGWWRDRAGAATRLLTEVSALAAYGVRALPGDNQPTRVFPRFTVVVEGAARTARSTGEIDVVAAPGSGDDAIVDAVRYAAPWERVLVVTADRALRSRCLALGASVVGPRWLLEQLPAPS
ncbi:NUDIX hydrolase [Rhizohabitans arisaemae]|uniref:NUDIX hydrolase n=1 Tax=Rhizohabitans arisaemae TaxID=2720610 RepID=UPI0024B187C7|nr:NUDIX domain-containing protein [Rhizohabitans arisaemae]